ncbi:MAG TPA: response regulator transcription factor [Dermatophilaceae bacterium]|nr:response regulator transcription factor [Dermatophilaceae bacterium]HPZ68736.1 response regulator transcription factor [Dermatophilaceae bacterium]HQD00757.1 response regulator transcription factor [Dermatophilaceae bacterium]
MTAPRLRIVLAEDVDLVAEALESLLVTAFGIDVVQRVGRGDQVLEAVLTHLPDVAVLDVDMPGLTGIEAAAQIREAAPNCRVLLLTSLPGSGYLHRALAAGASGYLVKSTSGAALADAIRSVAAGGTVIDHAMAADALRQGPSPITPRERDILRLAEAGHDTEAIAEALYLSPGTVRNYLSTSMTKLGAKTRHDAIRVARSSGWL